MVRHAHQSSRYDRSPWSLLRAVRAFLDARADIITLTEVAAEDRARMLAKVKRVNARRGRGFKNADDCAVVWKRSRWDFVATWTTQLTTIVATGPAPPSAVFVLLSHRRTGRTLLVSVAHLPAAVDGPYGFGSRAPHRVEQHKAATVTWRRELRELVLTHEPDAVLVVADWNLDLHRKWARRYVMAQFPSLRLTWVGHMPEGGTHGRRLIDATHTDMQVRSVTLRPGNRSSDHRPYDEVLVIPA